jgi:hypothetical protein
VAIGLVVEILGEAIEAVSARVGHRSSRTVQWLREATRPPPGLQLHAPDGSMYTGMVLFDSNRAVVVVALRRLRQDSQPQCLSGQSEFAFGRREVVDFDDSGDSGTFRS